MALPWLELLRQRRGFTSPVENVHDRQDRMGLEHPWSGVPHDLPHPLARLLPVAVDRTIVTGGLLRSVGTDVELAVGVVRKFGARAAKTVASMVVRAVHLHHQPHGLALALKSSRFAHSFLQHHSRSVESLQSGIATDLSPPSGARSLVNPPVLGLTPQAIHLSRLRRSAANTSSLVLNSLRRSAANAPSLALNSLQRSVRAAERRKILSLGREPQE